MKNQLLVLSIALLASVASVSAMQPTREFTGEVKQLIQGRGTLMAVLSNGQRIALDPSVPWQNNGNVVSRLYPQAPVSAPTTIRQAPAAPQAVAKPAAQVAAVATAHRMVRCNGGVCPAKPYVVKPQVGGCVGNACSMKRPAVIMKKR